MDNDSVDKRSALLHMLRQLLKEMEVISSQGAGYYTCAPFARRFNRLLGQTRALGNDNGLLETFDDLTESDPKDPSEKYKVMMGIRVEISQLIALLETMGAEKGK
jgi:hypothetical protein